MLVDLLYASAIMRRMTFSNSVRVFGTSFLPTVGPVTTMTLQTFSFFSSSGIFRMLPTPENGMGHLQTRNLAPTLKTA